MTGHKTVIEIARWEFRRWFKIRDQVLTLVISLVVGLLFWGGMAFLTDSGDSPVKIHAIDQGHLQLSPSPESRFTIENTAITDENELREQVGRNEIDGLLIVRNIDEAELIVFKEPLWKAELERLLTEARREVKIRELNIPQDRLEDASRPPSLAVTIHEAGRAPTSTAEKATAIIVVILMLLGVFNGVAYQFVSITGEKQLRVTEVIVSAVTPQQWIDGKILGTSLHSLAATITYAAAILVFVLISMPFGSGWGIPLIVADPFILASLVVVGLAGYAFWCTLFGALAATINDPNTSARSSLLMVPALPIGLAFFAIGNPDSPGMKILSIFPLTSPGLLPARLVLTNVAWWEVTAAVLLLAVSVWMLRSAAGRIFRLGMLMHGKEPSFKEMLRWARKA